MRAGESFSFSSPTVADSPSFSLTGGAYALDAVGNFNGGSVTLQRQGPDGATFITAATALSAVGTSGSLALPPGVYKIAVAGATGFSVSVIRIPAE
jgi:hypothetical protein